MLVGTSGTLLIWIRTRGAYWPRDSVRLPGRIGDRPVWIALDRHLPQRDRFPGVLLSFGDLRIAQLAHVVLVSASEFHNVSILVKS